MQMTPAKNREIEIEEEHDEVNELKIKAKKCATPKLGKQLPTGFNFQLKLALEAMDMQSVRDSPPGIIEEKEEENESDAGSVNVKAAEPIDICK